MKKIISVLLSALFVFSSSALVSAYDVIILDKDDDDDEPSAEERMQTWFLDYYKHKEHGKKPTETEAFIVQRYNQPSISFRNSGLLWRASF